MEQLKMGQRERLEAGKKLATGDTTSYSPGSCSHFCQRVVRLSLKSKKKGIYPWNLCRLRLGSEDTKMTIFAFSVFLYHTLTQEDLMESGDTYCIFVRLRNGYVALNKLYPSTSKTSLLLPNGHKHGRITTAAVSHGCCMAQFISVDVQKSWFLPEKKNSISQFHMHRINSTGVYGPSWARLLLSTVQILSSVLNLSSTNGPLEWANCWRQQNVTSSE